MSVTTRYVCANDSLSYREDDEIEMNNYYKLDWRLGYKEGHRRALNAVTEAVKEYKAEFKDEMAMNDFLFKIYDLML